MIQGEEQLHHYGISTPLAKVREAFRQDGAPQPHLRRHDYERWSYILDQLGSGTLLDVGIGAGQFVGAASATGRFSRIVGVDIRPHSELRRLDPQVELVWSDIAELPFDDGEFDIVTCLECLEHLRDPTFVAGLAQLRRVCRQQLVVTVPWDEQDPPPYHVQQFDLERVGSVFPDGAVTLLHKEGGSWPWALIIEGQRSTNLAGHP